MDLPPLSPISKPEAPKGYETYERPGMVVAYVMGPHPVGKGWQVGLDEEGLLVPITKAACFVGIANEAHIGSPEPAHNRTVNVTTCGSFVFAFKGWKPSYVDLQREVWAFDETTVGGAPFRTSIPVGRVVGIETTSDGRGGVRVKIDEAASKCLPPLPGRVNPK